MSESEHYLVRLESHGLMEDPGKWEHQINQLLRVAPWNPRDARISMQLARLHRWRAYEQRLWPDLSRGSQSQVVYHLEQASLKRPSWGLIWAMISAVKVEIGELDAEMVAALNRAIELGPWERQVQHQVIYAGILGWSGLPNATRQSLLEVVQRGLKDPALIEFIMDIAIQNNWKSQLEQFVVDDKQLEIKYKTALARHEA